MREMTDAEVFGTAPPARPTAPRLPRGLRNNNPGNIEDGPFARGLPGYKGGDGRFAIFDSHENGAGAQGRLLQSYGKRGINTVEGVISRWAPPNENNTGSYVKFVSDRMGVDPRAPLNMNDPQVISSLQAAISAQENGSPREMSDADVFGAAAPARPAPQPKMPPLVGQSTRAPLLPRANPADVAALATKKPKSFALGVLESVKHVGGRVAPYSPANLIPGFREDNAASLKGLDASVAERKETARPSGLGRFTGDVILSSGLAGPLSPLLGGAVSGAALGDSTDLKGLAVDAGGGALLGRATAAGSDALQIGARRVLSKAPDVMKPAELPAAVKAAYKAVDDSGFRFKPKAVTSLADDFAKSVSGSALSKTARDDAASIINYTRGLSKGPVTLAQLEKLRGDIYTAMVKKGGDTGVLGGQFRDKIDAMIDGSGDTLVREARSLNARMKKADVVTRASKSADRAAEKDYGGDYGRKLKDRLNPLVDEMTPNRNLRGATADEKAGLEKLVRGTKTQNLASTLGGMTDPRRLGGKILAGTLGGLTGGAGVATGGASLPATLALQGAQVLTGLGLTGKSSGIARKNLDELVKLIAAGGSKQAVARVPTKQSAMTEKAIAKILRPALVAAAVPGAAAAKPKKSQGR